MCALRGRYWLFVVYIPWHFVMPCPPLYLNAKHFYFKCIFSKAGWLHHCIFIVSLKLNVLSPPPECQASLGKKKSSQPQQHFWILRFFVNWSTLYIQIQIHLEMHLQIHCNSIFGFSYTLQSGKLTSCPISGSACIMARSSGSGSIGCLQQIFYNLQHFKCTVEKSHDRLSTTNFL